MSVLTKDRVIVTATIVVAASDSLHKERADFVCLGANDDVTIQEALDALPALGGEVVLLEGTYYIESPLVMDSLQTLRGCGFNTILTTSTALSGIINAIGGAGTEKHGIIIADLRIDAASTAYAGIYWNYVDNSEIRNVWVHDCSYNKGVTEWGGIQLCNCDYDTVTGCLLVDNVIHGIALGDSIADDYPCTFCKLIDNICLSNLVNGIILLAGSDDNTVVGNTCKDNLSYGIHLDAASQNTVSGNTCTANGSNGIGLTSSTYNTITGNTCQSNSGDGIGLVIGNDNNTVVGNICRLNQFGIVVAQSNSNTVADNLCQGNSGVGIALDQADNNNVVGNTCLENSQLADNNQPNIALYNSDYNLISSNICRIGGLGNRPTYGIDIQHVNCDHNMVEGNNLYSSGASGDLNDVGTNTHKRDNLSNAGVWLIDV